MNLNLLGGIPILLIGLCAACGPRSVSQRERTVKTATEVVQEGGVSPFEGRLSFKSSESMAIQEVPYSLGPEAEKQLEGALKRYRDQWTFQLTIGPKSNVKVDGSNRSALDIENNGGTWGDYSRNLRRLMFEMGTFISLRLPDGTELEPSIVEFQRDFGMGLDRSFVVVFPKRRDDKAVFPPFEVRVKEFGQGTGTMVFPMKTTPDELALWRVKRLWKVESIEGK